MARTNEYLSLHRVQSASLPRCVCVYLRPSAAAHIECMLCATYNLRESVARHLLAHISCSTYDTFCWRLLPACLDQTSATLCRVLLPDNLLHPHPPLPDVGPVRKLSRLPPLEHNSIRRHNWPSNHYCCGFTITPQLITRIGATWPFPAPDASTFPSCRRSQTYSTPPTTVH